jgi:hypothetical protein
VCGRAVEYGSRSCAAVSERHQTRIGGRRRPSSVFAIDVERAGYITFGEHRAMTWDTAQGLRELPFPTG